MQQGSADVAAAAGEELAGHAGRHVDGGRHRAGRLQAGPERAVGTGAHQPARTSGAHPEADASTAESGVGGGQKPSCRSS